MEELLKYFPLIHEQPISQKNWEIYRKNIEDSYDDYKNRITQLKRLISDYKKEQLYLPDKEKWYHFNTYIFGFKRESRYYAWISEERQKRRIEVLKEIYALWKCAKLKKFIDTLAEHKIVITCRLPK